MILVVYLLIGHAWNFFIRCGSDIIYGPNQLFFGRGFNQPLKVRGSIKKKKKWCASIVTHASKINDKNKTKQNKTCYFSCNNEKNRFLV